MSIRKRLFDVTTASVALWVFGPVVGAAAAAVWLTNGRPVVFRQVRVGQRGRDFTLLKFRTMRNRDGAERGEFDAGDTSRITPIGRWLRASKVDELPQLYNVVRGDMSMVGPRPEVRKWVEVYPDRFRTVHQVRPGITDPASIQYRNEEDILARSSDPERTYREDILPKKLDLYERYVRGQSLLGDILILVRTVPALLSTRTPDE